MKRELVLTVAGIMALSTVLSGCGKGGESSKPSEAQSTSAGEVSQEATEINMFISIAPEFDPEVFPTVKALEEKLNVKINYEIPPSSSYEEKLQIVLSSGDYPDVMLFPNQTSKVFLDAVKNEVVVPITQWIDKAENLKAYTSEMTWDSLKVMDNDEIYGIPRTTPFRADGFLIRGDWCENLGIELPEDLKVTKEELYDIMERFTKEDPDGNGQNDTYGFTINSDANGNMGPMFAQAFGLLGWQEMEGEATKYMQPIFARNSSQYKDTLTYMAKLWSDGIMDPNAPTIKTNEDRIDRFKQGKAGIIADFGGNAVSYELDMQKLNPEADVKYVFLTNADGEVKGDAFGVGMWWLSAITSAAKGKEETIVNMYDYMLSDEGWDMLKYGPKDVTWKEESGKRVMIPAEFEKMAKTRSHFAIVRRNNDPDFFFDPLLDESIVTEAREWVDVALKTAVPSLDRGYRPPMADDPAQIDYRKKLDAAVTKVILGNETLEGFDKALDDWYAHGGEQYVKEVNDYIEKQEG